MTGFSAQNLWLARQFFLEYRHLPILQQLVGEIPWGHNILIIQKIKSEEERRFYVEASAKLGWSRDVLLNQIKANVYRNSVIDKSHNFGNTLPAIDFIESIIFELILNTLFILLDNSSANVFIL